MLKKIHNGGKPEGKWLSPYSSWISEKEGKYLYKIINSRIPRHNPMSCIIVCDKIAYCQRQNKNKLTTELTLHLLQYHI